MEHIDITLPAELKTRAEALAREEGVSLEKLVRELLELRLRTAKRDPFFANHETFDGGPSDLAENHDKYLYDEDS